QHGRGEGQRPCASFHTVHSCLRYLHERVRGRPRSASPVPCARPVRDGPTAVARVLHWHPSCSGHTTRQQEVEGLKVLITGATGVIGHATATELLRRGHTLRLLSRHAERDARAWDGPVEA